MSTTAIIKRGPKVLWASWESDFIADVYPRSEWSTSTIAQKLERSVGAVRLQASKLGVKRPLGKRSPRRGQEGWTDWENDFLADVYPRREWSIAEIAAKLERSVHSVQIHAAALGIRRPRKLNYDAIRRLDKRGLTPTQIGRELGYSRPAVSVALKTIKGAA